MTSIIQSKSVESEHKLFRLPSIGFIRQRKTLITLLRIWNWDSFYVVWFFAPTWFFKKILYMFIAIALHFTIRSLSVCTQRQNPLIHRQIIFTFNTARCVRSWGQWGRIIYSIKQIILISRQLLPWQDGQPFEKISST